MTEGKSVPYLRVANVFDGYIDFSDVNEMAFRPQEINRFRLLKGDILLNEGQSVELVGRCAMFTDGPEDCCYQNTLVRYRAGPSTDSRFALQLFRYCQMIGIFSKIAVKTNSIAHLGVSRFAELELPFPPYKTQVKIAEILDRWDTAVQKTEQLIAAKEQRLAALRQKLFARGSRKGYAQVNLASVLKETGELSDGNLPVYSVSVHKGLINQVEHLGRSFSAATTAHYSLVRPGYIVYTKSPTGDFPYGIVKQSYATADAAVSPLYGVYRPSNSEIGVLVDFFFESPVNAKNYLHPLVQKGAKNTISIGNEQFLRGEIALPDSPEQIARVSSFIREARGEIALLKKSVAALITQKRGLMQKLLTGQWRLPVQEETG